MTGLSNRLRSKVGVGAGEAVGVASVCGSGDAFAVVVRNNPGIRNSRNPATIKEMARRGVRFFLSVEGLVVIVSSTEREYFSMDTARDESEEYPKNVIVLGLPRHCERSGRTLPCEAKQSYKK